MKLYRFSTWGCYGEKDSLFKVEEFEVEEKPKTYVNTKYRSRINKDEINKLKCGYGNEMYCFDNTPKTYINAMIERKTSRINSLKEQLNNEKKNLEKWEKALRDCEVSDE